MMNGAPICVDEWAERLALHPKLRAHLTTRGYADVAVDKIFALLDFDDSGALSRDELRYAFLQYAALRFATGARSPDE